MTKQRGEGQGQGEEVLTSTTDTSPSNYCGPDGTPGVGVCDAKSGKARGFQSWDQRLSSAAGAEDSG